MTTSQQDKILLSLRRQGSVGACTMELYNQWSIMRVAARINDLKRAGHQVDSRGCTRCSSRHARYFLVENEPTLFDG